jgi:hypothetical protein
VSKDEEMNVPFWRSSFASCESTSDVRLVDFLALSLGTICPQPAHWITPLLPLLPLDLPRLFRLKGNLFLLLNF